MKSKFSYKSKRTIIIAAVITVLLAGTATGVYFFTKGNAQAQAAGDGNTTMQEEQHGEAPIENQSGEQTTTPSNNEQEETNQNQTGEQQTTEEQQENQEQTTNTQSTQNNQTTTTATTGEVPNQEYVTEREETIINPWETLTVGWGPTQFAPIVATANLNANKSNLTIAKIADKENVKTGDTITYTISVENTGDKVAKAIIYDNIPEGTVLLDKDNKEDENTKKLTWRVTVEPGKVEKVEFTVRVKSTEGTIKNAAIVNGKTTNETKTGVVNIKTTKISTPSATPLHEMDQITYTLTAKNSGDGEGIVKISDIVPQGTTLVENSIKLENKIYTEAELNEGIDVTLGGKEEKSITFTVTINPFKEEKIIIRNAEAKQDGENIPGTEDEVEKEYVSININKEFVDKENIDKYRPTEVLFGLYANENSNAIITTTTLNEQNNWKGSFTGLDKYDLETKALINYDVREIEVDKNYTPTYDSERKGNNITFNFTNILKYENVITSVTANKIWNDNEGKVGARTSVTFELYKDGEATGITQTASDSLKWKVTFQNLQKYHNDGTPIKYTVVEITKLEHYKEPSYTNIGSVLFVTNTIDYTTFSKDVKITKKWVNPANTEHSDITIDLYQSGNQNVFRTVTLKNGETEYTFTNLPKYDSEGNEYIYTAVEQNVEGYTTSYSDDKLTIINTINQENTVKVEGTKTWVDPQGTEHPTITINLLKNGTIEDVKTLENGTTTYSFENLPKYKTNDDGSYILDENGNVQLNVYTVTENAVEGYTSAQNGTNFTNTINQEKISVSGTKTWIAPQGTEHPTITINLLKDSVKVDSRELTNGITTYSFDNLDKYDLTDGHEYVYTVSEETVRGYTSAQDGTNFTNTIKQEKISVSGTKTWIDPQGTEHPTITINLLKDGNKVDFRELTNGTTTYSFDNLEKYDLTDGHEYVYTVTENTVEGYTTTQDGTNFTNTIEQDNSVSVVGTKVWIDPQGTEHQTITITLLKDGEKTDKIVTLENGNTQYSFTGLDKYAPDGHIYEYTVEETPVEGYTTTYSQDHKTIITNTINQEKISVSGTKTWIDPQGTEHPTITINLLRNGVEIDSRELANGTTTYSFDNLDKYAPDGSIYNYTVEEENVEGYTTTQNGTNFTNTIKQEKISVSGTKTWIDPQGTEHPTITINLLRNGVEIDSRELANGTTTYSFDNLDKYAPDGSIYNYTVEEENVEGYTTTQNGTNFTNTIKQEKISVSGTKTWIDPQGTEHPTITINLLRNGVEIDSRELANGTTTYSFDNLDKYAPDGSIYNYTVEEENVEGYTTTQNGTNFTNTIKQEKISVSGTKTWIDPQGTEHPTITINLLRNGVEIDSRELANGTTTYSFDNLDKYAPDGSIYNYTVEEENVEGYTTTQNGTNFTNTIKQEKISVSGTKTWIDPQGTEHPTITINLLRNGVEIDSRELANGTTTYSFDNLDKYAPDGSIYNYTVEEENVEGYTTTQNGTDFTNTIEQDNTVEVAGTKTWVEPEGTTLVHPEITIDLLKNGQPTDKKVVLENGTTEYKFENLPKYKVDENGEYVLDNNGNVQLNEYSVRERTVRNYDTSYDGYNITNTFNQDIQGTIEITTTTTSQTSVKTPLDVVFVLDVSGSMNDNDKDKKMVNAVNSAITTIMKENPDSRIGVVAYSSKEDSQYSNTENAITLLELGKYTPKTAGKYLTIQENVYYDYYWKEYYDTISTNVNEKNKTTINVYGGTFTQAGIKAGASILTNATTTYTTTVNGKEKTITRTPVMILLSDGDPTYYKTDFEGLTGSKQGNGNNTTENEAYYTIRTADHFKKQITSHYYGTTGTKSKFYTIGLNMSGTLSETILNPTAENVNKCDSEGYDNYGWISKRNVKGKLYDKIIADGSADKYSYADKSYVGTMTTTDLENIFNTIIDDNSTSTEMRDITLEESNARRVNLEGIDTSKEFKLTIESTTYNFETAQSNGYVKGNDTEGYYVDLTNVEKGTSITISYHK